MANAFLGGTAAGAGCSGNHHDNNPDNIGAIIDGSTTATGSEKHTGVVSIEHIHYAEWTVVAPAAFTTGQVDVLLNGSEDVTAARWTGYWRDGAGSYTAVGTPTIINDGEPGNPYSHPLYRWTFADEEITGFRIRWEETVGGLTSTGNIVVWEFLSEGVETPPPPPPPPGITVSICDNELISCVELTHLVQKRLRVEKNEPGNFDFVIARDDPQATADVIKRGNIVQIRIGEIHSDILWEGVLETGDFDLISSKEEGGELLHFGGRGTMALLEGAVVDYVEGLGPFGNAKPDEGVWRWALDAPGAILRRLILEAQTRTPDPTFGMTLGGAWDDDTHDSLDVAWSTIPEQWEVEIGKDLLTVAKELIQTGLLNLEMVPGNVLWGYEDYGTDRTSTTFATGKVRFVKGHNIASELSRHMAGMEWASDILVRTKSGYDWKAATGTPPYRRETFLDLSSADGSDVATRAAQKQFEYRDGSQEGITLVVTPWGKEFYVDGSTGEGYGGPNDESNGWYYPGPDWTDNGKFWLGDLVTVHTGSSEFDYVNSTKEVIAITLYEDQAGDLAPAVVELAAPIAPRSDEGLSRRLTSGSDAGSGTGSGGTSGPKVPVHLHHASNIAMSPFGTIAATNVQAGLEEIVAEISAGGLSVKEDNATVGAASVLDFGTGLDVVDQTGGELEVHVDPAEIKLDDLGTPDDNTDLNASTSAHGLLRKLDNDATHFLNGQGGWTSPTTGLTGSLVFEFNGGGAALTTSIKVPRFRMPFAGTWTAWTAFGDSPTGSVVLDLWKDTFANDPPTDADRIAGTDKPTLSSDQQARSTSLTGWTTSFAAGDVIAPEIESVSGHELVTLQLDYTRT